MQIGTFTTELCSFSVGETRSNARFSPVRAEDKFVRSYFLLPTWAYLFLDPPDPNSSRLGGKTVLAQVKMEPSATFYQLDRQTNLRLLLPTNNFPPRPGNFIFEDGSTCPDNLRELIADRALDQQWGLSFRLASLLFSAG